MPPRRKRRRTTLKSILAPFQAKGTVTFEEFESVVARLHALWEHPDPTKRDRKPRQSHYDPFKFDDVAACPFCGFGGCRLSPSYEKKGRWVFTVRAVCQRCTASVEASITIPQDERRWDLYEWFYPCRDMAMEKWNTRVLHHEWAKGN